MRYELKVLNENEVVMDVKDGAVMLTNIYNEAVRIACKKNIRVLRITQNGEYLADYFKELDKLSVAHEVK